MRNFAQLYTELDASTATGAKLDALERYLARASLADAAWGVYFLAGGRPRQIVRTALLRLWACEAAGLPDWLFEESYQAVGDLAETIAHVLPAPSRRVGSDLGLGHWVEDRLLPLRGCPPQEQASQVRAWWDELDTSGRFLLTKLMGGGFRVGVSRLLVTRALARHAGLDPRLVAQRMMGYTAMALADARPGAATLAQVLAPPDQAQANPGQPYPFFLAHALDEAVAGADGALAQSLGAVDDWQFEWKADGIRAQVIRREGQCWIWTRGEELVTDRYPEVVAQAAGWPDGTVLDGELLVWRPDAAMPEPFAALQRRIGRKTLGRRILAEAPVCFLAYDLLAHDGQDHRARPLADRRAALERVCAASGTRLSAHLLPADWAHARRLRAQAREHGAEGLMIKQRQSGYGVGRTKADGVWWKWKVEPLRVDAVLIYAQRGHGRRAGLYTDYTFAVWNQVPRDAAQAESVLEAIARREPPQPGQLQLLPFAKAYSGLSDTEFAQVDRVIRATTLEKFGPVRSVRPTLVIEIGFEGLQHSPRHKSGVAVRFPRMLRLRPDKPLHEADSLATLQGLLAPQTAQSEPSG